jgi:hypothetical protein
MCFSATASFSAAAITGTVGVMALAHVKLRREVPLASMPLLFSVQQAIEGTLWMLLPGGGAIAQALVNMFTIIALVIWPPLVPLAISLVETHKERRHLLYALIPAGMAVASYSALSIARHPYAASLSGAGVCYVNGISYSPAAFGAYLLCTCVPPLLSTDRRLKLIGATVTVGMFVSAAFYYVSFISVWCFFAAVTSALIYAYFRDRTASHHLKHRFQLYASV